MRAYNTFAAALALAAAAAYATPSPASSNGSYEYIVVGSGAAGGTVAAGLARKGHSVLLLEAGGNHGADPLQQIPIMGPRAAENETMAWHFWVRHFRNETQGRRDSKFNYRLADGSVYTGTEPPEGAEPLGLYYPRGATVGGSSQVNAMSFQVAPNEDWNYITELTGDDSWSAAAMHQYFIAIENCTYVPEASSEEHGWGGYMSSSRNNLTYITQRPAVMDVMSEWARGSEGVEVENHEQLAELLERDTNIEEHRYTPGVYRDVGHTDEMRRRSGAWSNIMNTIAEGYPLTLSTHSLATKILFNEDVDGEMPKAVGVEYIFGEGLYGADGRYDAGQRGALRTAMATLEVIVAGGAFNTPQLLKLSGVGPREELESLEIPVVVDLPAVGENLHDHSEALININASRPWEGFEPERCEPERNLSDPCALEWANSGTGPYGEAGASVSVRFRSSVSENDNIDVWLFGATNIIIRGFYPGYSNRASAPETWAMSMIKVQQPGQASKGTVRLASTDPRTPPIIDFNWLEGESGERDLQALAEAAEFFERSFSAAPEEYHPFTRNQPPEGVDVTQNLKDEAFGHHASSTCKIGRADDPEACVDHELRVRGVRGLRVVDASVFPYTPSAFPVLPITMLGEKAADVISGAAGYDRDA